MKAIELQHNLKYETDVIRHFLSPGDPYEARETILNDHPKLKAQLESYKKKDNEKIIKEYLRDYYKNEKITNNINFFKTEISRAWGGVENDVMQVFMEIFDSKISNFPKATAYIGSISIYPRDIKTKTFLIGFKQPIYSALKVILHEYTHFIYFDKWKKLFPKDSPQTYDAPNKLWYLSEVLAVVINSDERFLRIIPDAENQDFYFNNKSFYNTPMPGTDYSVIGYYKKLYLEHKKRDAPIDEFLKKCRESFLKLRL